MMPPMIRNPLRYWPLPSRTPKDRQDSAQRRAAYESMVREVPMKSYPRPDPAEQKEHDSKQSSQWSKLDADCDGADQSD